MQNYFSPFCYLRIVLFGLILLQSLPICAKESEQNKKAQTIKVAILDSFYSEMPLIPLAYKYETAYLQGVKTASYTAKRENYTIQSKFFLYGIKMLDILQAIPEVDAWKADLVIGSNSSDQFLLLNKYLHNILVLSSYASDINIKKLPKNFYSTFLPDDQIMQLLGQFIYKKFPQKNIYVIEQVDCKQCVDVGQLFIESYGQLNSNVKITENKTILDNINTIDSKELIKGHEKDVILIFNNTYYGYNLLIRHISKAFPDKHLIFFSDQDNWNNEVDGRTHPFDLSYESYRIGPILFDSSLPEFKTFTEAYVDLYHKKPQTAMSYMTYVTLMSVLEALRQYPCPEIPNQNMREKILCSYQKALEKKPNWFRKRAFGIYRLTSKGEVLIKRFSMKNLPSNMK